MKRLLLIAVALGALTAIIYGAGGFSIEDAGIVKGGVENSVEDLGPLGKRDAYPAPLTTGTVAVSGAKIYYTVHGDGEPLVLLHGGLGNTESWSNQVAEFARSYRVISIASRGHGRSTNDDTALNIHLMASDVIAVLDELSVAKASVVGWSDGANIGLDLAIHHPGRLKKLFAFGANFNPGGAKETVETDKNFAQFFEVAAQDYKRLSPTPDGFDHFVGQVSEMWESGPNFTPEQLSSIAIPVMIFVGENDEAIEPEHTKELATLIPNAKLIIMPEASHFALWQKPHLFNKYVLEFLEDI